MSHHGFLFMRSRFYNINYIDLKDTEMTYNPYFVVAIRCMTYNHAPYIEDAMNGFCMQRTTFPYVAIIIDDASTDGESEVIQKYLDEHFILNEKSVARQWETSEARFIYARHKENPNCYFAVILLKYNYYSIRKPKEPLMEEWNDTEYVAVCEGDDYWIYTAKLQEQISYLNANPDYGMVFTDYDVFNTITNKTSHAEINSGIKPLITNFEQHLRLKGYMAPMSWVYRRKFYEIRNNFKGDAKIEGSFIFALEMFLNSKIYYMNKVTCVYRVLEKSASHHTNLSDRYRYHKDVHKIQEYYVNNYDVSEETHLSLSWFYEIYATYIILNGEEDEMEKARDYLKEHFVEYTSLKQKFFIFCLLFPFTTWLYKNLYNIKLLIQNSMYNVDKN